jgi:hypothetical protein
VTSANSKAARRLVLYEMMRLIRRISLRISLFFIEARSRREQPGWSGARDTNQGGAKPRMFVSRVAAKPGVANRRSVTARSA